MSNGSSTSSPSVALTAAESTLAKSSASSLFQLAWGALEKGGKRLWEEKQVRASFDRYTEHYLHCHGKTRVFGKEEPVPLNAIYTKVSLLRDTGLQAYLSPEGREKAFRDERKRIHQTSKSQERIDGIEIAQKVRFLNVLGGPGYGKTTFLRRLGYEVLESGSDYSHEKVPVLLYLTALRETESGEIDLVGAMAHEFSQCGFPESRGFVERMLKAGKLLVLLDGLDEVAESRLDAMINAVQSLVKKYGVETSGPASGNRFVTSCRTAQYHQYFEHFTDVALADFEDDQIRSFARLWFTSAEDIREGKADSFVEEVFSQGSTHELARTPILLTSLALVYDKNGELPSVRASLYKQALGILLRGWARKKGVHHGPVSEGLHHDLEVDMLAWIAHYFFEKSQFFFQRDEVIALIGDFMSRELKLPRTFDAGSVLEGIAEKQGLLVQRDATHWSFSHPTIQEILTARYLYNTHTWPKTVEEKLFNEDWREVFLLLAGMGAADKLLQSMSRRLSRHTANFDEVADLYRWAEGMVPVKAGLGEVKQFELRVLWAALACSISRNRANTVHILGLARNTTPVFARNTTPPLILALDYDLDRNLVQAILSYLDSAEITPEVGESLESFVNNSINARELAEKLHIPLARNAKTFADDLQATTLLVHCRKAAYSLQTKTWNEICSRLLSDPRRQPWQYGWTYSSSALEGNSLTLEEVAAALSDPGSTIPGKPIEDLNEARAHHAALEIAQELAEVARTRALTQEDLFQLHHALMQHAPVDSFNPVGKWKVEDNLTILKLDGKLVENQSYATARVVPNFMQTWVNEWNRRIHMPDTFESYLWLHVSFVRIHPFADGNGRLARIVANIPRLVQELDPILIDPKDREEYILRLYRWQTAMGNPEPGGDLVPPCRELDQIREFFQSQTEGYEE